MPTPSAVEKAAEILGQLGGKIGGPARAKALSKAERHAIAVQGGKARRRHGGRKGKNKPPSA